MLKWISKLQFIHKKKLFFRLYSLRVVAVYNWVRLSNYYHPIALRLPSITLMQLSTGYTNWLNGCDWLLLQLSYPLLHSIIKLENITPLL